MEQSVGWGVRDWCGCCREGVTQLIGSCTGGVEVIEVIDTELQVGSHGIVIQVVEVSQSGRVVLLDGGIECGSEELDRVVGGDGGRFTVVEVGEVGGGPSLLFMASSRLRTWLDGVQQIEQSCRTHRDVLVQVRGSSWRGVSVLVLVLVLVSAVGSMLSSSRLN